MSEVGQAGQFRDLDHIQENDGSGQPSRLGALVLASVSGACIVFAVIALTRNPTQKLPAPADPLGDLVAKANPTLAREARVGREITFPTALSDTKNTTALEIVREAARAKATAEPSVPGPEASAVAASLAERLPPAMLPAQHVLESERRRSGDDPLSSVAREVARERGAEVEAGGPGGYQLQVSSFNKREEAERFSAALRRRGHKAYVEPAYVPGRGLWHRVRIGPFKYKHSAVIYRQDFEAKERIVTFIVDPPKTRVVVRATEDDTAPDSGSGASPTDSARLPQATQ